MFSPCLFVGRLAGWFVRRISQKQQNGPPFSLTLQDWVGFFDIFVTFSGNNAWILMQKGLFRWLLSMRTEEYQ